MLGSLMLKLGGLSPVLLLLVSCIAYPLKPAMAGCEAKSCGRVTNISHPFWLRDPRQPPCGGLSSFELSCEDGLPILVSSYNSSYYLQDIFYGNKSFWVRNKNFNDEGCAIPNYDIRVDLPGFFRVSAVNTELRFFYNCWAPPTIYTTRIDCAPNATFALVGGRYGDNSTSPPSPPNRCNTSRAPVLLRDGGRERSSTEDIKRLLKNGFLVEWGEIDACWECSLSNGRCSHDDASASFVCICPDGRHSPRNCRSKSNRRTVTAGAACVGVAGLVVVSLLGLLFFRREMWKRLISSVPLHRTASSGSTSEQDPEFGGERYVTQVFKYEELQKATGGFSSSNQLGDGGFGTVYKGNLRDGRTVAIKRLYEHNCRRVEQFMTEVRILSSLRHPNLVTLYGCTSRRSRELLLVYEYVPNGTVADHLHGPRAGEAGLPWATRMSIAIETADALSYLHAVTPQIIHRDVKTNNILLDNSFHVKVADFGLSRLFPVNATHVSTAPQGTPGYVDPEYHRCYQLTDKSDVYSFGVVLVEIIASKPAVDISRRRHEINLADMAIAKIQNDELDQLVDPNLWCQSNCEMIRQVAEVAFSCLQADGDMRPTMKEVVEALRGIEDAKGVEADAMVEEDDYLLKERPAYPIIILSQSRSTTSLSNNNSQSK
ncbi:LEAF RUST 10 DISEASE-RESISTANCE LOCUS RECEPTOR-LIKE PROTEIN KINASE-like 1.2 isoform X1 [Musa acuminata AAA Group]|uniref:LEAF RUST 10 DISEASE-RESISTANCE LOCUS RECEPTOR-LIKE PROTEIN KINASE-like 1.2 isoform X1 n=1 Tax=Musa acuminata AAA Group TaxID=214697 RepID=UPI0031CDE18B